MLSLCAARGLHGVTLTTLSSKLLSFHNIYQQQLNLSVFALATLVVAVGISYVATATAIAIATAAAFTRITGGGGDDDAPLCTNMTGGTNMLMLTIVCSSRLQPAYKAQIDKREL